MLKDTCAFCGAAIEENECAVALADGSRVCAACAARARIKYPRSMTWANVTGSPSLLDKGDSSEDCLWIDPLEALDRGSFAEAMAEADALRASRTQEYGTALAYFRVFEYGRAAVDTARGRQGIRDEFVLRGEALLGDVPGKGTASVSRREGMVRFEIGRVETPTGNGPAMAKADFIPEGCTGRIVIGLDVPVYPGDVIEISGNAPVCQDRTGADHPTRG